MARLRLARALPQRLARDAQRLEYARERMTRLGHELPQRPEAAISMRAARLGDLSPLAILGRGYAVCFAEDGTRIVKSITEVSAHDTVRVRVGDGQIVASVSSVEALEER